MEDSELEVVPSQQTENSERMLALLNLRLLYWKPSTIKIFILRKADGFTRINQINQMFGSR